MKQSPVLLRARGWKRRGGFVCAVVLAALGATLLEAQISEADKKKRDAFLKAREEMHTISASPTPTPSGKPKPSSKKKGKGKKHTKTSETPEPTKTPSARKKKAAEEEEQSPSPKRKKSPAPKSEEEEPTPRATPEGKSPPPRAAAPVATPPPVSNQPFNAPADITIQKSGLEEDQGYQPPPSPPPRRGFWSRVFGSGGEPTGNYHYLSRSVIDAIRRAPVQRARWKFIIVHNSGTRQGNARAFDYYHRRVRRMQNGLAYHFVVGNGTSSGNGQIEVGDRWRRQINGGHVHSDYLNNISLGICLVGDFNRDQPTRAQLQATEELIRYLRERCGRVEAGNIPVRPHREMNPPRWATDCPGDAFPYSWFRRF
ncbi:MAG: peptidoglycan recognition protein family protein [Verrucomicrobiota bacterium]|nr:peptidoglycan recognition protein family protein [Verrucomicrobiota bacterium]